MKTEIDTKAKREYRLALAKWMLENWCDRPTVFAQWTDWSWVREKDHGRTPGWFCNKRPLSAERIARMLEGREELLGAYFIDQDTGLTKTVLLDIDGHNDDQNPEKDIYATQTLLLRLGIPFVLARSKSAKGYHVRIRFADKGLPAYVARRFGAFLVDRACLPKDTEIFPKQDEVPKGQFGSQVALPGSKIWHDKTGGSCLLHFSRRDPIPLEDWLATLEATPAVSEKSLREFGESVGIDFFAPVAKRVLQARDVKVRAEGVALESVEDIVALVEEHGLEAYPSGGKGTWSDVIHLNECFNSEAHGSTRSDGAAILFDEETGRIGYNCFHAACQNGGTSWPKILRKLGYRVKIDRPDGGEQRDDDRREDDGPHEASGAEREKVRTELPEEIRDLYKAFYNEHADDPKELIRTKDGLKFKHTSIGTLAGEVLTVATCGRSKVKKDCNKCRKLQAKMKVCDGELLCPSCARRAIRLRTAYMREKGRWKEGCWHVRAEVEHGNRTALRDMKDVLFKKMKRVSRVNLLGRTIEGVGHIDVFWPTGYEAVVKNAFPDAQFVDGEEAIRLATRTYYEAHLHCQKFLERASLFGLQSFSWYADKKLKRVTGSTTVGDELPFPTLATCREHEKKKWETEHPGLEVGDCDSEVGRDEKDQPLFCGGKFFTFDVVYRGVVVLHKEHARNCTDKECMAAIAPAVREEVRLARANAPPAFSA